jgi:hypothetical protein
MPPDWYWSETPPAWLAVVFAFTAVVFTAGAYGRERKRDREEQASHIGVWPYKARPGLAAFELVNSSSGPVWEVVVFAYAWNRPAGADNETWESQAFDVGVTPPYGKPRVFYTGAAWPGGNVTSGYNYAVSFRDSANRHWYRTRKGELHRGKFPDRKHPCFKDLRLTKSPPQGELR